MACRDVWNTWPSSLWSPQNPPDSPSGFCGARSPSCHVFHTSRQAMIKTYNIVTSWRVSLTRCIWWNYNWVINMRQNTKLLVFPLFVGMSAILDFPPYWNFHRVRFPPSVCVYFNVNTFLAGLCCLPNLLWFSVKYIFGQSRYLPGTSTCKLDYILLVFSTWYLCMCCPVFVCR